MGKINMGRVILGGILGGIVFDILDYPVDGVWLAPRWTEQLALLGKSALSTNSLIGFELLGILGGIATIWIYAAIRPRFGPGVKTAVYTGVVVWFLGFFLSNVGFMYLDGLFTKHLTLYTTVGNFFEVVIGTIVGAWFYKET